MTPLSAITATPRKHGAAATERNIAAIAENISIREPPTAATVTMHGSMTAVCATGVTITVITAMKVHTSTVIMLKTQDMPSTAVHITAKEPGVISVIHISALYLMRTITFTPEIGINTQTLSTDGRKTAMYADSANTSMPDTTLTTVLG